MLTETFPLELVSPAFLAGADQTSAESCELRVATLRGQLRWWWRTLHAAWLDVKSLRDLEAAVWGSTEAASPVRLSLRPVRVPSARLFDYKDGFKPRADFRQSHSLAQAPDNKTTQGLFYLAYGMDENVRNERTGQTERRRRYYLEAGEQWELKLVSRASCYPVDAEMGRRIPVELIHGQAQAALSLLCRYGGVGSKARKGFGSFAELSPGLGDAKCKESAEKLLSECGIKTDLRPQVRVETPSIDYAQTLDADVALGTTNSWTALDRLGFVVQEFAQRYAHQAEKEALGLPRKIHGPRDDGPITTRDGRLLQNPKTWQPPIWLGTRPSYRSAATKPSDFRHAAPVHYHLAKAANGELTVRVIAFPSPALPDLKTSEKLLGELLEHIKTGLAAAAGAPIASAAGGPVACSAPPRRAGFLFLRGDRVATPEGDGVVDADVRIGARRMDVDFGDGDIGTVDPAHCRRLA